MRVSAPTAIQFPNCIHKPFYSLGPLLNTEVLKIGSRISGLVLALLQEKTLFFTAILTVQFFQVAFRSFLSLYDTLRNQKVWIFYSKKEKLES